MTIEQVRQQARRTARSRWIDTAARVGFIAKGAVSAIIGVFALKVAAGDGGAFLDSEDTTRVVALQPFGAILLVLLGLGLACHALWLLVRAMVDPDGGRPDAVRTAKRIGWGVGAVLYGFLAVTALQTFAGSVPGGHRSWVQAILGWHGGRYVMMVVGAIVIGAGVHQLREAYTTGFRKDLDLGRMSPTEQLWAVRIGRFGVAARGVVLPIVGWFLLLAGTRASASQARGTGAALREIASQPWGQPLVTVVAAGFVAYAVHMAVSARYWRSFG